MRWLAAAWLLFAPAGSSPPAWSECRRELAALALALEIMDPREARFVCVKADEFDTDLAMLRRRWQELQPAPPLDDSQRFPDRAAVNELLVFNRAYRKHLEDRQPADFGHADEVRHIIRETDQLYQVWDAVRDARCEHYYVTVRRHALQRLRDLLGDDAYYAGHLPPHVPIWRFAEVGR